jgi:hypothetical protein
MVVVYVPPYLGFSTPWVVGDGAVVLVAADVAGAEAVVVVVVVPDCAQEARRTAESMRTIMGTLTYFFIHFLPMLIRPEISRASTMLLYYAMIPPIPR